MRIKKKLLSFILHSTTVLLHQTLQVMLTVVTVVMTKGYTNFLRESVIIPYSHYGILTEHFIRCLPLFSLKEQKNSFELCFVFTIKEMTFRYGNWLPAKQNV
jgi:hypothetical protein